MMDSAPWGGQDQPISSSAAGSDFHHFLDMNGIASIGDAMQFDFHGFQADSPRAMIASPQQRQTADTLMTNSDHPSAVVSARDGHGLLSAHPTHAPVTMSPVAAAAAAAVAAAHAAAAAHASILSPHMLDHRSAADEAITMIDAQIHFLQQQKYHQQQQQQQQQQRQMREHHAFFSSTPGRQPAMVSTPQSIEMTPGSGQFYSKPDHMSSRAAYERGYHQRLAEQQDMAFTPLVSPAVTPLTPLDHHFNMDSAFVVPAAYFSPLTSPALRAQNDSPPIYDYSSAHSNNSPAEMNLDSSAPSTAPSTAPSSAPSSASLQPTASLDFTKKHARKNTLSKVRPKPGIKSSPICKPQRRKTGPSPALVSQVLSEVGEGGLHAMDHDSLPLPATSTDGSDESSSVSPDAMTDMPPPPIPAPRRSTSMSPYIQATTSNLQQLPGEASNAVADEDRQHPATPASLMKLPASQATGTSAKPAVATVSRLEPPRAAASDTMESLELPEAVSNRARAALRPIDTQLSLASPPLEPKSSKGVTFSPLPMSAPAASTSTSTFTSTSTSTSSTSRRLGGTSADQSPHLQPGSAGVSSSGPLSSTSSSLAGVRKTPLLGSRHSRRRSSGSVHISPPLLPKISPNIKPLLPGRAGMSAEDQASRLLISKSNYQNILEGNQVPGISYPSELSTNITSKRTSHKIAEQGRRNRINSALQIMAGLLPESRTGNDGLGSSSSSGVGVGEAQAAATGEDSGDRKEGGKHANASNSKASVVENAIVHMQKLEKENGDLKQEVQALKEQLEELRSASHGTRGGHDTE